MHRALTSSFPEKRSPVAAASRPRNVDAARVVALALLGIGIVACGDGEAQRDDKVSIAGISGDTISVGALVPLSDAVALVGKPILAGQEAYFAQLNAEKGGVAGKYKVRIIAEDVTYANPSTSVQKYNKLKDRVALFSMILGTDHVNVTLPLLAEDNLLALPTTMDAEWVREPHLISVLAPYQIQMINGVDYWVSEGGGKGKKLCVLVMSTGYGSAAEEGVIYGAKELGVPIAASATFRPGDQDFVAPITRLKNAGCQGVALASLPTETAKIMGTASQLGFSPRWIATAPSWHVVLGGSPIADYARKNLWLASEGTEWGDTTAVGMRNMQRALQQYAPNQKIDPYFMVGYIFASTVGAVLEKAAAGGDLSRAGLATALTSLGTVSLGGLSGDYQYGPIESRQPPRGISIFSIDPSRDGGQALVKHNHISDAGRKFPFVKRR